ncbi:MAG: hypothetical protein RBR33_02810 [Sulfurovaceae bacterium]|nr:hypothetical protein [Sulfurovaceae bacterium]
MVHNGYYKKAKYHIGYKWRIFLTIFVILYPMFVSVHSFLPFFFGVAGYVFMTGIRAQNIPLIIISSFYLLNLEINLSMPLFGSIIAVLLFYLFIFPKIKGWMHNKSFIPVTSVMFIYLTYYIVLFIDDLIFLTSNHNINFTWILFFSFVIDILLMVFYDYNEK